MPLKSVAVLLQEPVSLFEYGVLAEVFGIDRTEEGIPAFDYRVCAESPGPLDARNGTSVTAAYGLEGAADADLVAVPASNSARIALARGRAGAARRRRPGRLGDVGVLGRVHPGGRRHPRRP